MTLNKSPSLRVYLSQPPKWKEYHLLSEVISLKVLLFKKIYYSINLWDSYVSVADRHLKHTWPTSPTGQLLEDNGKLLASVSKSVPRSLTEKVSSGSQACPIKWGGECKTWWGDPRKIKPHFLTKWYHDSGAPGAPFPSRSDVQTMNSVSGIAFKPPCSMDRGLYLGIIKSQEAFPASPLLRARF